MKQRAFKPRLDQSPAANLQRLYSFIRSIDSNYKPMPRLQHQANLRSAMRRVK
jgi:hypothetical protein